MKLEKIKIITLIVLPFSFGFSTNVNSNWQDDYSKTKIVTASSIEKLNENVSSINPIVDDYSKPYLKKNSALGTKGPISAFGPLGLLGPIGTKTPIDPNYWVNILNVFLAPFSEYFSSFYGSNSTDSPLGHNGPYTEKNYYYGDLFLENNFAVHLRALGLWNILGTTGPLGPVGALGVLGPVGSHGFKSNSNGQYIDKQNNIVTETNILLDYNDNTRTFPLYEYYDNAYALSTSDLDTSFVTKGKLKTKASVDEYPINNTQDQILSILVVPINVLDHFNIELDDSNGNVIANSNSKDYINFIILTAQKNTSYTIKVSTEENSYYGYFLYVTGSTKYLNKYNISGDYIIEK